MSRRFVGEGELSTREVLGGNAVLMPLAALTAIVLGQAFYVATREGPTEWWWWVPTALVALLPLWWAWRSGVYRALVSVLRGDPRPRFCLELDELVIRTAGRDGKTLEFDWFEVERFQPLELGMVLWLRAPKDGANAIVLPRRFFAPSDWEPLVALVREKLPSSAKAIDAAASAGAGRRSPRRTLLLWALLIVLLYAVYQLATGQPPR